MPLVGVMLPGQQGYLGWKAVIDGKEIPYGLFLGEVVNFLIVALALFIFIVKFVGWICTKKEEQAAPASAQQRPGTADRHSRLAEKSCGVRKCQSSTQAGRNSCAAKCDADG